MPRNVARHLTAALLLAALPLMTPQVASAGLVIGLSVRIAPPLLPVYTQPPPPAPGYLWTPGYWAWSQGEYYWVPGTWVLPPAPGLLWTPGYWGWSGGVYVWHPGYWGPHVGFYGGVNYGFGYTGVGFVGGAWHHGVFYYNRAIVHVGGVGFHFYDRPVPHGIVTRVAFNGGRGGIVARPTAFELRAEHEHHVAFTAMQRQHEQQSFHNVALRASHNGGHPRIGATARPGEFGHGAARREAPERRGPGARPEERRGGGRPEQRRGGGREHERR